MSEQNSAGDPACAVRSRTVAVHARSVATAILAVALVLTVVACGSAVVPPASPGVGVTPAGATPPASRAPGFAWDRATVQLPGAVTDVAPGTSPDIHCSPCHAAQVSLFTGVARVTGGLLAVGVQEPPSKAIAFESADGRTWAPVTGFAPADDTLATSVAAIGSREVIVGGVGSRAAAWVSVDGSTWTAAPAAEALGAPAGGSAQISAVVAWHGRFVAAGYRDPDPSHRVAAIWVSEDGLTWRRVANGLGFGNARAFGIAAGAATLVVVGASGDQSAGAAVAWTSSDAEHWAPVSSPAFAAGSIRAVAAGPSGFVAVGAGIADDRAVTWTSPDGLTWETGPATPDLQSLADPVRMLAVTPIGTGFVAAGWKSDAGNGSGVIWRSDDGRTWSRVPDQVSMSGGTLSGVVGLAGRPIVVGTSGYPDNDQATIWIEAP